MSVDRPPTCQRQRGAAAPICLRSTVDHGGCALWAVCRAFWEAAVIRPTFYIEDETIITATGYELLTPWSSELVVCG
jgi:hypothetical protein